MPSPVPDHQHLIHFSTDLGFCFIDVNLEALALQCPRPIIETCLCPYLLFVSHNYIIHIQQWYMASTLISNLLPMLHLTEVLVPSYIDLKSHTIFSVAPFSLKLQ